jgi:hypothetical protein
MAAFRAGLMRLLSSFLDLLLQQQHDSRFAINRKRKMHQASEAGQLIKPPRELTPLLLGWLCDRLRRCGSFSFGKTTGMPVSGLVV